MQNIFFLFFHREILADKARGKRGRCTRSRTPPVRIPIRKNQKAVNNKNNARAKQLFSLPVSPLAKENGKKNTHQKSFDDDNDESDITKDDDSDENNIAEPVRSVFFIFKMAY